MIKAVFFDCFGVLATEAWTPFKAKHFSHDPELMRQATETRHQADRGQISYDDSVRILAELAGITPAKVVNATERSVPNEPLFAYIKELKSGNRKIGLLSNVAGGYLRGFFSKRQLELFDVLVLSYESGLVKPQPEAFISAAKQLGVEPSECVFIDDKERHCAGARAVGMQAVRYEDFEQMKAELKEILNDPKR